MLSCFICRPWSRLAFCWTVRKRLQFWVEIGNEQGLTDSLVHDVVAVSGAMQSRAKQLKLPFNLSFVVGGNGWVPKAFTPMMEALAPGISSTAASLWSRSQHQHLIEPLLPRHPYDYSA